MNTKPVNFVTIGSSPLLSGNTNFIFEIHILKLKNSDIDNLNSLPVSEKINLIYKRGGLIKFKSIENKIFGSNLILIESYLPQILAETIICACKYNTIMLSQILKLLEQINPLGVPCMGDIKFYTYKIKELLRHLILGMQPKKIWCGEPDVYDHYPIMKDADEILYYTDNINKFIEIVMQNTKLQFPDSVINPSSIYVENEKFYIKLNLQLNFEIDPTARQS